LKKTLLSICSILIISSCSPQTASALRPIILELIKDQIPNAITLVISSLDVANTNLDNIQQDNQIEKSEYDVYKEKVSIVIREKNNLDSKLNRLYDNSNNYIEALKKRLDDIKDTEIKRNSERDVLEIQNNLIPQIVEIINFSNGINKDIQILKDIEASLEIKMGLDLVKDSVNKAYEIKNQLVILQNKINYLKQEGNKLSSKIVDISVLYTIQVASRKSYDEALELSNNLPNSKVRTKVVKGVSWNAVTVGEFSTKDQANSYLVTLKEKYSNVGNSDDIPEAFVSEIVSFND
jgi:hypothetical protein